MAHYAFIDENNLVVEVIAGIDENETIDGVNPETWYSNFRGLKCVRTSYNKKIRKNYAGIGMFYDENLDAFIPEKPFDSWILDELTCNWFAPRPYPTDSKTYCWDESLLDWVLKDGE